MSSKDQIYRDESMQHDHFVFDDRVVRVFPDMIRRSVPGYGLIVPSIALLARRHIQPGTNVYDLGCSLGAVSFAMMDAVGGSDSRVIAVDNSPEMIGQLREQASLRAEKDPGGMSLDVVEADIMDVAIENASFVVMNFTLQFIDRALRPELLSRIAEGMRPGGVLVLSEKLRFSDEKEQDGQTAWHLDFKRAQGYSELEIARKRDALETTLLPDTFEQHSSRLKEAGFSEVYQWFQCFSFASMVAIR